MKIRTLIVEDHPTMRLGIRTILEVSGEIEVVGEATNAHDALLLARDVEPEVVVLDLRLGDTVGGVDLCRKIKSLPRPPRVVIHSAYNSTEELYACRLCGADGFVHKSEAATRLPGAVKAAHTGASEWLMGAWPKETTTSTAEQHRASLTARETEILDLLTRRRTNPEIASELSLSPLTVKTHVARILNKLGLKSRRDIS